MVVELYFFADVLRYDVKKRLGKDGARAAPPAPINGVRGHDAHLPAGSTPAAAPLTHGQPNPYIV